MTGKCDYMSSAPTSYDNDNGSSGFTVRLKKVAR